MTLVLDTSILIDIERKDKSIIEKLHSLALVHPDPAKITFVTQFEFLLGIKKKSFQHKEQLMNFLNNFVILHTTRITAEILSDLKQKYDKKGVSVSLADLLIAALVIENNMVLVTKDTDFNTIEEMKKIIV